MSKNEWLKLHPILLKWNLNISEGLESKFMYYVLEKYQKDYDLSNCFVRLIVVDVATFAKTYKLDFDETEKALSKFPEVFKDRCVEMVDYGGEKYVFPWFSQIEYTYWVLFVVFSFDLIPYIRQEMVHF